MKRVLALILAAFMMMALFAACNDEKKNTKTEKRDEKEATETIKETDKKENTEETEAKAVAKEYAKSAILRLCEGNDKKYKVFEYIKKDTNLYKKYSENKIFKESGENATTLAEEWEDKFRVACNKAFDKKAADVMRQLIDEEEGKEINSFKDLEKDYLKITAEKAEVSDDKATVLLKVERIDLEKLEELAQEPWDKLKNRVNDEDSKNFDGLIAEVPAKTKEIRKAILESEKITTYAVVSLEKDGDVWYVTGDKGTSAKPSTTNAEK